jgi:tetratricopeptide (TPR) repeat protein
MGEKGNEAYKKIYSPDNIRIGWSSMTLASIYLDLGLYESALPAYEQALAI